VLKKPKSLVKDKKDRPSSLCPAPGEQHLRALVLLATLAHLGLLEELDVLELEAVRGKADAE
jgi:hypothetical protein